MSVSQLTKDLGYRVLFDLDACMIQVHIKGLMIGRADRISNLYVLDAVDIAGSEILEQSFASCSNVMVDANLWHNRLGHPSVSKTNYVIDVLGYKKGINNLFTAPYAH